MPKFGHKGKALNVEAPMKRAGRRDCRYLTAGTAGGWLWDSATAGFSPIPARNRSAMTSAITRPAKTAGASRPRTRAASSTAPGIRNVSITIRLDRRMMALA